MKREDVILVVNNQLTDKLGLGKEEIDENAHLTNDLGADSLDAVEVVMAIEKELEITISDDEAEAITTPKEMYDVVEKKMKEK